MIEHTLFHKRIERQMRKPCLCRIHPISHCNLEPLAQNSRVLLYCTVDCSPHLDCRNTSSSVKGTVSHPVPPRPPLQPSAAVAAVAAPRIPSPPGPKPGGAAATSPLESTVNATCKSFVENPPDAGAAGLLRTSPKRRPVVVGGGSVRLIRTVTAYA